MDKVVLLLGTIVGLLLTIVIGTLIGGMILGNGIISALRNFAGVCVAWWYGLLPIP